MHELLIFSCLAQDFVETNSYVEPRDSPKVVPSMLGQDRVTAWPSAPCHCTDLLQGRHEGSASGIADGTDLPLTPYVSLSKLFHLSKPQFLSASSLP